MLLAVCLIHPLFCHPLPFDFLGLLLHSLTDNHYALDELVLQGKGGEKGFNFLRSEKSKQQF